MSEKIIEKVGITLQVPCIEYERTINLMIEKKIRFAIFVIQGLLKEDPEIGEEKAVYPTDIDYEGLGKIKNLESHDTIVNIYLSSTLENTKNAVLREIKDLRKVDESIKIIMVGHSMGADNIVELTKENRDIIFNFIILLDIKDATSCGILSIDDDNINENVENVINYYQEGEKMGIGGEKIEIINPQKTKGVNILSPGSNHRSIDNDLKYFIIEDIINFKKGKDAVMIAKNRKLPIFRPSDSDSEDVLNFKPRWENLSTPITIEEISNPSNK
mgnify:CR=1 FL=1